MNRKNKSRKWMGTSKSKRNMEISVSERIKRRQKGK